MQPLVCAWRCAARLAGWLLRAGVGSRAGGWTVMPVAWRPQGTAMGSQLPGSPAGACVGLHPAASGCGAHYSARAPHPPPDRRSQGVSRDVRGLQEAPAPAQQALTAAWRGAARRAPAPAAWLQEPAAPAAAPATRQGPLRMLTTALQAPVAAEQQLRHLATALASSTSGSAAPVAAAARGSTNSRFHQQQQQQQQEQSSTSPCLSSLSWWGLQNPHPLSPRLPAFTLPAPCPTLPAQRCLPSPPSPSRCQPSPPCRSLPARSLLFVPSPSVCCSRCRRPASEDSCMRDGLPRPPPPAPRGPGRAGYGSTTGEGARAERGRSGTHPLSPPAPRCTALVWGYTRYVPCRVA